MSNIYFMLDSPPDWTTVNEAACRLGVTAAARLKWRQGGRGVPPVWRIRIPSLLAERGAAVAMRDFDALPVTPGRIAA